MSGSRQLGGAQDAPTPRAIAKRVLDALVFSSQSRPWRDVMVAGRWVTGARRRLQRERIARGFEAAMQAIRAGA